MTEERRYSESEVEEIFERATEAQARGSRNRPARDGMSLTELQEIGREVGVSPDLIESAARSLERPASSPPSRKRFFGVPIGVGRTVPLPRRITDEEWHRLVADLRDTFDARGAVEVQGRFREWRNGNLRAIVEPSESGERLRLRTVKGGAKSGLGVGAGMAGGGAFFALLDWITGGAVGQDLESLSTVIVVGVVFLAVNLFRLPPWASTREEQFERVSTRLLGSLEEGGPAAVESGDDEGSEAPD